MHCVSTQRISNKTIVSNFIGIVLATDSETYWVAFYLTESFVDAG